MSRVLVEVCCGSAEDVIESFRAGADRVELCSDLFHGGLTPSLGSLRVAKRETDLPIMAMVRPREGGFCYTEAEFEVAKEDAKVLLENGADGLVFGFLKPDGHLDEERTALVADIARSAGKQAVFHRAFDVVPDWRETMDRLVTLGITRILTSGQESDVSLGTDTVRDMIDYAGNRVEIMPGAGITARNLERIVRETGCCQVHVAAYRPLYDHSTENNRAIFYGGCLYPPEDRFSLVDRGCIAGMVEQLA